MPGALQSQRPNYFPPDNLPFGALLALIIVLYLTISPLALDLFGFSYEESGGNPAEKIHPATMLAMLALGFAALANRNPLTAALNALIKRPKIVAFIAVTLLAMAHAVLVARQPFTPLIDTFVAPVIMFYLFKDISERRALRLGYLVHALLAINALIGVAEYLFGFRLTPLSAGGLLIEDDWRSTALLGHPLSNASLTGAYLLALAVGAGRGLPGPLAVAAFVISCAGMVVFGGRAATVLLFAMLALLGALQMGRVMLGARFATGSILRVLIVLPLAALAIVALSEAGVFDQFIYRFIDDKGSADARVQMFELFRFITFSDLLIGPEPAQIATLKGIHGLEFGIESFWVSFVMTYGLVVGLIFFAGLFAFCRELVRTAAPGAAAILLFFFLVGSTSVSLSAKTPLFAILVLLVLILLKRPLVETGPADAMQAQRRRRQTLPVNAPAGLEAQAQMLQTSQGNRR